MNATTQAPVDGRSARWARHREERRAELLDVARHLIHEKGPDVTMEDIAAASGTSKSIVYRYFEDKAHLQRTLGRSILTTMHHKLLEEMRTLENQLGHRAGADERLHAMIRAYVETAHRSPGVYRFVTRPSDGLNHFLAAVSRLVATFLPQDIPAPQVWAHGAVGFVARAVDTWMTSQELAAAGRPAHADHAPGEDPGSETGEDAGSGSRGDVDADIASDAGLEVDADTASDLDPDFDAGADAAGDAARSRTRPDTDPAPLTSDQLVSHLVTWLMKGLHA